MDYHPRTLTQPSETVVRPENKKILIVENDEDLITVYRTRLEIEGFKVSVIRSGKEILEKIRAYKPDLIILDIKLPHMHGLDALAEIRKTHGISGVKVVVVTALALESESRRAHELGVVEYLVKSKIVLADMVDRIKEQLGINIQLEELSS